MAVDKEWLMHCWSSHTQILESFSSTRMARPESFRSSALSWDLGSAIMDQLASRKIKLAGSLKQSWLHDQMLWETLQSSAHVLPISGSFFRPKILQMCRKQILALCSQPAAKWPSYLRLWRTFQLLGRGQKSKVTEDWGMLPPSWKKCDQSLWHHKGLIWTFPVSDWSSDRKQQYRWEHSQSERCLTLYTCTLFYLFYRGTYCPLSVLLGCYSGNAHMH